MIRARGLAFLVLASCVTGAAHAGSIYGGLYWYNGDPTQFRSVGYAFYQNDDGATSSAVLSGSHTVTDSYSYWPAIVFETQVYGDGHYDYTLQGPAIELHCYDTSLHVIADPPGFFNTIEATYTADPQCVTAPEPIEPPGPITLCDDGSWTGNCSPIVINLGRGSIRLSGSDDPTSFDIDADGVRDRITWTARESAMAFLALDRNGNGRIDDGSELFGDSTRLASGARAANGFAALSELDTNGDGMVSGLDPAWLTMLLWVDDDHDGISRPDELQPVSGSGVQGLETRYHWTGRRDASGNLLSYQGTVHLARSRQPIYDVYFRSVR